MKVITLYQPWALCMAWGLKTIETRGWATRYRGQLAIHAAGRADGRVEDSIRRVLHDLVPPEDRDRFLAECEKLRGHVLCIVNLHDCIPVQQVPPDMRLREAACGNFGPGRHAWLTRGVRRIEPVKVRGKQGLWDWNPRALRFMR